MEPLYTDNLNTFYCGDAEQVLAKLPEGFVQSCVTSPPYFGLRDYGVDGQIGNESTPAEFVDRLVSVFRQVRRVLRPDGTLWLNLGDSYAGTGKSGGGRMGEKWEKCGHKVTGPRGGNWSPPPVGLKQKDLMGIPWRVALALQDDGWYLRQDIIWQKPTAMPSSVKDRTTTAHEYVFLLTKSPKYFFDHVAIKEPAVSKKKSGNKSHKYQTAYESGDKTHRLKAGMLNLAKEQHLTRNARSVWSITTSPFKGAHYATFPPKLVERCLLAGTSEKGACTICGAPWKRVTEKQTIRRERPNAKTRRHNEGNGVASCDNTVAGVDHVTVGWERTCGCQMGDVAPCVVLDPFIGSGTTAKVANQLGHQCIGIDLSAEYLREHAIARVAVS